MRGNGLFSCSPKMDWKDSRSIWLELFVEKKKSVFIHLLNVYLDIRRGDTQWKKAVVSSDPFGLGWVFKWQKTYLGGDTDCLSKVFIKHVYGNNTNVWLHLTLLLHVFFSVVSHHSLPQGVKANSRLTQRDMSALLNRIWTILAYTESTLWPWADPG